MGGGGLQVAGRRGTELLAPLHSTLSSLSGPPSKAEGSPASLGMLGTGHTQARALGSGDLVSPGRPHTEGGCRAEGQGVRMRGKGLPSLPSSSQAPQGKSDSQSQPLKGRQKGALWPVLCLASSPNVPFHVHGG